MRAQIRHNFTRYAGLAIGPLAWALNTQLGQILPYAECRLHVPVLALCSFALAFAGLAATYVTWRWVEPIDHERPNTRHFTWMLSVLTGALFAFVLILQGLSSVALTGCER